jgi:hypothetical protein
MIRFLRSRVWLRELEIFAAEKMGGKEGEKVGTIRGKPKLNG